MSRRMLWMLALVPLVLSSSFAQEPKMTATQHWKLVTDAINEGLPKTAIEALQAIIDRSKASQIYDEAIKAVCMKIAIDAEIQQQSDFQRITALQTEIAASPEAMRPVMRAVLANWYWQYFNNNRWRFMQRTQVGNAAVNEDDIQTWDLARILVEVDSHFQAALSDADELKNIPVSQYDELLEPGVNTDGYRPTLFDVLTFNAIDFYSTGEQAASKVQDAFELSADDPIFGTIDQFVTWQPASADETSLVLSAVKLFQSLLSFHQNDADRSALLDADLYRLQFGNNVAGEENKTNRYRAALKRFADENASHQLSSRALYLLAESQQQAGELVTAHAIATQGERRFPGSIGGRQCHNLIAQVESPEMSITTERVWNDIGGANGPTIDLNYKNVSRVYFRLVPLDFDVFLQSGAWSPEQLNQRELDALVAAKPVASWSAELPKTDDYQSRNESVAPADFKTPGSYFLIASANDSFQQAANQVSICEVWISDLALVTRNQGSYGNQGVIDGFVLRADDGTPVVGATVTAYGRSNRDNSREKFATVTTDDNGMYRITGDQIWQLVLRATKDGQSLATASSLGLYQQLQVPRPNLQTVFFTDRAIYRPGQTVQFKGICISHQSEEATYKTLKNRSVNVVFNDVNGEKIESLRLKTNGYGSFSGSFTAPRDRLTGRMTIAVGGEPSGQTSIRVEEYKRPKFQVTLNVPDDEIKLGDEVTVPGVASAYTGAAIDGAKVTWRVVREVRYPIWWMRSCWWMPIQQGQRQEIADGIATTDSGGRFSVPFVAKPDASVARESEPVFSYTVYADVTDTAGETRSDETTVRVGYTSVAASMSAGDYQTDDTPVTINVRTESLGGDARPAKGTVKVYELIQPGSPARPSLRPRYQYLNRSEKPGVDPANPDSWPQGEVAFESNFSTDASGATRIEAKLDAGIYRAVLETSDRSGVAVRAELPIRVLDPDANKLEWKLPFVLAEKESSVEPGETFSAIWGSGYASARAYVEIERVGEIQRSYWTDADVTQATISQPIDESMRGGFTLRVTMVHNNRAHLESRVIDVPWTNKNLNVRWDYFTSKLDPAAKETWTAIVTGPNAETAAAEMVATLYDASLDAYATHNWMDRFNVFRRERSTLNIMFENQVKGLSVVRHGWQVDSKAVSFAYPRLPEDVIHGPMAGYGGPFGGGMGGAVRRSGRMAKGEAFGMEMQMAAPMADAMMAADAPATAMFMQGGGADEPPTDQPNVDFDNVSVRTNLNETAFFFPQLIAGKDGSVRMQFTMPEALTQWRFIGFAHDQNLRSGSLSGTVVTAKDLMVQPNPPRFVREGDQIEFTVKVSNQSPTRQTGSARLTFADAITGDSVDARLQNAENEKTFQIAAGESQTVAWRIVVPDGLGTLVYKAVGATERVSDGEEGYLPVLSRRVLVAESIAMPIRGKQTKQFDFEKLIASAKFDSIEHQSVTAQMVSNPSWYAVMALPYLMEYPHQCSEQTFNRMYANALARHIATSDPKIERVFAQWRATPALDSPLEKNEDLKSVTLEETPWVRDAADESQARRNVGILFDQNRLEIETKRALDQLAQMQLDDGTWPWFPGGRSNDYITLYITTGFGRLRHLGVDIDTTPAIQSLTRLDAWMTERYKRIKDSDRLADHLDATVALYLYGRSFFRDDQAVAPEHRQAFDYWMSQAKQYWVPLGHRQSQAHLAIAAKRFGDLETANAIMKSLTERSLNDDELGMHWADDGRGWWWYHAPIESQAMMIEAFDEVADDAAAVEDCKVWLLKQKQTQNWKTTKATADAVYALLLRGTNVLSSDKLVEVTMGGETLKPSSVEAGTGFYEQKFVRGEVKPSLGEITVTKLDDGVAWGSVHWQYLIDMADVTPADGTPLKLTKALFIRKNTPAGPTLIPVDGPVNVGDELVVRIVLRSDRDMEYLHLKDYRGSGTEPVSVLSGYRFQDGLAYYESTRDAASHFFIDYLPQGTYVFEYSTRVQLRGQYQTGYANIQCMYAPEFAGHSESLDITVE